MARDLETLVVQLSADFKKYENAMNKAMGVTNNRARAIESRFKKMNAGIASGFGGLAGAAGRAFALIGGAEGFRRLSDSATRIDNALKVAGLSGEELEGVYQKLLASAQKNAAPLETLIELYGRVSLVQGELGISSEQLVGFADNIAIAVRASGKSSEQASGALIQLSQALGAGVVRAEEFNSIQEGAPTILQAAAAGIKEAGGSVATLRKLMLDGRLSSKAFFDGINVGTPVLEEKLAGAVLTIDQRFENLKTSLVDAAREFNRSSGVAAALGEQIDNLSAFISGIDWNSFIDGIRAAAAEMNSATAAANAWAVKMSRISGFEGIGRDIVNMLPGEGAIKGFDIPGLPGVGFRITSTAAVTDRINQAFEAEIQKAGDLTAEAIQKSVLGRGKTERLSESTPLVGPMPSSRPAEVKPVSLADYKVPASGSGGSGRKGGRNRVNDYEREIQQIKERTAALQAESAAQAGVNPLVNDYGYAVEYARTKQELLTAAQQAGIAVTPELEANIDMLARAYGNAVVESEKLAESQDRIRQAAEDFRNTAKDVTSGFISDLRSGKTAAEALAGALDKVADKMIDMALSNIFGTGGSGGFSLLSFLGFKGGGQIKAFAGGGKLRGPGTGTSDSMLIRASDGEYMVNAKATKKHLALLEAINSDRLPAFASGGLIGAAPQISAPRLPDLSRIAPRGTVVNATYAPVIDNRGASVEAVARMEQALAQDRQNFRANVVSAVRQANVERVKFGKFN